ncbi:MAG: hypothetical protein KatS3mg100_572 [Candidatus Parcubacteria bacterium]|nr:MAG: hypothetical protein KatS3mg100_572 [Candidatus Parcubacteria bacterium]
MENEQLHYLPQEAVEGNEERDRRIHKALATRRQTLGNWLHRLSQGPFAHAERDELSTCCFQCMDERVCAPKKGSGEKVVRIAGALVATPSSEWEALAQKLREAGMRRVILQPHQGCGAMALRQQDEGNKDALWSFTIQRARDLARFLRERGFEVEVRYQVYAQGGAEVGLEQEGEVVDASLQRALDESTSEEHEACGVVVVVGDIPEVVRALPRGMFVVSADAKLGEWGDVKAALNQVLLAADIAFGEHNVFSKMFSAEEPFEIVVLAESAGGVPDIAEEILREIQAALAPAAEEGKTPNIRARLVRLPIAHE